VGTDDGLIHLTRDAGKTWADVTPPQLTPWAKVSVMDASHFDVQTAYAAVNTFRLDDLRPHIYRTRDAGKTWTHITDGIPDGGIVNVVREDPQRRGLLFAGTERSVHVSFDDGGAWHSLRLNMPATSIRDLVVKDDDLVIGTHGRSFWILDDITPLRQVGPRVATAPVHLYRPQDAWRVRWNMNTDTPLPPDEPAGENPPDGAVINYWLRAPVASVLIEIVDAAGRVARRYTSEEKVEPVRDEGNAPQYWIRPAKPPGKTPGMYRLAWDLRYTAPKASYSFPIAATPANTPRVPAGVWAQPGAYTVRLTAGGQTLTAPLRLRMDPRVKTTLSALDRQFTLSMRIAAALNRLFDRSASNDRARLLYAQLLQIYNAVQGADVAPASQVVRQAEELLKESETVSE
jgi:hypothetical protein